MSVGYVYVLINPSFKGLVKIGKTTRNPEIRAKELSASTGVPTEFIVAFDIYVSDCSKAEEYLHALLESKGYRLTENKEFFNVPLKEVIKLMLQVQEKFKPESTQQEEKSSSKVHRDKLEDEFQEPWRDILQLADTYYY